jgi:hypothetical protein
LLYKSPCRRHRCHYVSFASEEVEVRKEKKEDQKKHLCLFEEQEIQSETEEQQQNLKPKEDPKTLKKNLITIETIYQSLLTYLKETIRKLPGKQNKPLKSNCSLLKLET